MKAALEFSSKHFQVGFSTLLVNKKSAGFGHLALPEEPASALAQKNPKVGLACTLLSIWHTAY